MTKTLRNELLDTLLLEKFGDDIKLLSEDISTKAIIKANEVDSLLFSLPESENKKIVQQELSTLSSDLHRLSILADNNPLDLDFNKLAKLDLVNYSRKNGIHNLLTYIKSLKNDNKEDIVSRDVYIKNELFDIEKLQEGFKALEEIAKNIKIQY